MDVSNAIAARSDQLNAIDLLSGERTVQILEVTPGSADQPVVIVTDIFGAGRPFKPSKTALRVIVGCWGSQSDIWIGRRMTLYRDPDVRWAGEPVGGIRISAMSHIDKPQTFSLAVSKGKNAKTTVQPLKDAPAATTTPTREERVQAALKAIHDATNATTLANIWERIEAGGLDNEPTLIDASTARTDQINGG